MEAKGLGWAPGFRMNADWELAERNAWRKYFDEFWMDACSTLVNSSAPPQLVNTNKFCQAKLIGNESNK